MSALTKANDKRMAYIGSRPNDVVRDSDSWYTPEVYVDAARAVMGGIDLDPFSSKSANQHINARWIYTIHDSAFDRRWWLTPARRKECKNGLRVWMNPPYSSPDISNAVALFSQKFMRGEVEQAVVLTNNATETRWFAELWRISRAICFTDHRISFVCQDGKRSSGNTRGQAFFYICSHSAVERERRFLSRFSEFGHTTRTTGE